MDLAALAPPKAGIKARMRRRPAPVKGAYAAPLGPRSPFTPPGRARLRPWPAELRWEGLRDKALRTGVGAPSRGRARACGGCAVKRTIRLLLRIKWIESPCPNASLNMKRMKGGPNTDQGCQVYHHVRADFGPPGTLQQRCFEALAAHLFHYCFSIH